MELYIPYFPLSLLRTVIFSNKAKLTTLFPDLGFETTSNHDHATISTISDRLPRLNRVSAGQEKCSDVCYVINVKETFNLNRPMQLVHSFLLIVINWNITTSQHDIKYVPHPSRFVILKGKQPPSRRLFNQ